MLPHCLPCSHSRLKGPSAGLCLSVLMWSCCVAGGQEGVQMESCWFCSGGNSLELQLVLTSCLPLQGGFFHAVSQSCFSPRSQGSKHPFRVRLLTLRPKCTPPGSAHLPQQRKKQLRGRTAAHPCLNLIQPHKGLMILKAFSSLNDSVTPMGYRWEDGGRGWGVLQGGQGGKARVWATAGPGAGGAGVLQQRL